MKTINITMKIENQTQPVKIELYEDIAPITVRNFTKLIENSFYDGLIFHRVIKGFMIQGGDPEGTGLGGSENNIKGEFTSNGFKNHLKHTKGVISMARSRMKDSASSQFFIMLEDCPHLDGEYAAFGKVTSGMNVIDSIGNCKTDADDRPKEIQKIQSITIDK